MLDPQSPSAGGYPAIAASANGEPPPSLCRVFSMGHSVVVRLRHAAFSEQNGRCFYCDSPMWLDDVIEFAARHHLSARQARWLQATAEHLVPRHEGGRNADNIVAACRWCNWMRHSHRLPQQAPSPSAHRCLVRHRLAKGKWRPFGRITDLDGR
jgi:hypothetical protein